MREFKKYSEDLGEGWCSGIQSCRVESWKIHLFFLNEAVKRESTGKLFWNDSRVLFHSGRDKPVCYTTVSELHHILNRVKCKNRHWSSLCPQPHSRDSSWLAAFQSSEFYPEDTNIFTALGQLARARPAAGNLFTWTDNGVAEQTVPAAICRAAICEAIPFCNGHIHPRRWYPPFCLADLTTLRLYRSPRPAPRRLPSLFSSQSQTFFSNRPKQLGGLSWSHCTQKTLYVEAVWLNDWLDFLIHA